MAERGRGSPRIPTEVDAGADRPTDVVLRPPRLLVFIDAVARQGSIRKAAASAHVAPSALDRRILDLERQLGTTLFERSARGMRPTAAGEIVIAYARRAMADADATRSQIEQLHGLVRGDVTIASAESIGTELLPRVVAEFQQRFPGVRFHFRIGGTETLLAALLDDLADLVVAHDIPPHDGLDVLAQIPQPLCALVRPDHPLAERRTVRFAECARYPMVLGDESFGSRRLIQRFLEKSSLRPEVVATSSSVENLKAMTRCTGAVSFQFRIGTLRDAARGELVAVPLVDRLLASSRLVLAVRRGRTMPIASAAFVKALRAALGVS